MRILALSIALAFPISASAAVVCKTFDFESMSNEKRGYLHPALFTISLDNQSPPPELDFQYSAGKVCATDPTFDLDTEWTDTAIDAWIVQALVAQAASDAAAIAALAARRQLIGDAITNWATLTDAEQKAVLKVVVEYLQSQGL